MDCRALICEFKDCHLIYENPVILPCGYSLCQQHLADYDDQIICFFCKCEHQKPPNGFTINIAINRMIESYIESNQFRKETKEAYDRLNRTIYEYDTIDNEKYLHDYFEQIRNRVDLHREEMINEINEKSDEIIKKLKEKEQYCKLNLIKIVKIKYDEFKNNDLPSWKDSLRIADIDPNELKCLKSKIDRYDTIIQRQCNKYKNQLLQNQSIQFEKHDKSSTFGELIEKNNDSIFSKDCGNLIKSFDVNNYVFRKCIQVDENSQKLITASSNNTIKIFDLNTGHCLKTLYNHQDWVTSILITSDNNKFISGSMDRTIKIWDLNSYECLNTLGNGNKVSFLCFISNNELASGCDDGIINLWSLNSLNVRSIKAHDNCVVCLKLIDNSKLASCSSRIKIWNLQTLKCINTLEGHSNLICCLELISNEFLLSCSEDQTVKLWNINTGEVLNSIDFDHRVYSIKLFNNDLLSVGLGNGEIIIINNRLERIKCVSLYATLICQIHLMTNGDLLIGSENEIKLFNFLS